MEYVWFHMEYRIESIWNRNIPWIPHGFHMEWKYSIDSTQSGHVFIPYGFHVDSMWIPGGFHMESMWNGGLGRFGDLKKCIVYFTDTTHYGSSRRPEI